MIGKIMLEDIERVLISEEELISLMDRLTPVNNKANTGNRKEYVVALKNLVRSMLPDITEEEKKYFNTKKLVKLIDTHKQGKADLSRKIWTVYTFLVWYKEYF